MNKICRAVKIMLLVILTIIIEVINVRFFVSVFLFTVIGIIALIGEHFLVAAIFLFLLPMLHIFMIGIFAGNNALVNSVINNLSCSDLPSLSNIEAPTAERLFEDVVPWIMCLILAAIALPSFLHHAILGKQAEAKQYVTLMNKAQIAYFSEKKYFANSVNKLNVDIKSETTYYKYSTNATRKAAFNYAISRHEKIKSYVGGVFAVPVNPNAAKVEMTTVAIVCESKFSGITKTTEPKIQDGKVACGDRTTERRN